MAKYQHYVIFEAVKDMLLAYLNKLNISMKESTKIINETIDFCKRNSKAIDKKDVSLFESGDKGIIFDEEAFIDVIEYLQKEDENQSAILDHLSSINYLIDGGLTEEELFLNKFVTSFASSFNSSSVNIPEFSEEGVSDESIEAIGDVIKPTIEKSLEDFQTKNLNVDRFMKSISFKVKEYIEKNDIPGIHKNELHDILDMTIENDVSELFEKKFEIFAKLSSSGLLAHLPLDKIMTLVPSNMEDSVQSELNNLSLE